MKILGLSQPFSGCGYHRVILPLGFLPGCKGYVTNFPVPEILVQGWDILLYNRIAIWDKDWQKVKEDLRVKVIMDIDDHWDLPPSHINYSDYQKFKPRIINNLKMADLVTVTNEALAVKCLEHNDNVVIIPNALPFGYNQYRDQRREDNRVRIFWAGGITHEQDIFMLRNPIKRLSVYRDKIKMVLGGYSGDNPLAKSVWDRMFSHFTAGGTLPYMKISGTDPESYMALYENADIMVIPLENSKWHACKSNLKILEAASKRIPCIVSRVEPYSKDTDAPVLWVDSQKDWFEHLSFLINNPGKRKEMGDQLFEWANSKYNLLKINEYRRRIFADLIKA